MMISNEKMAECAARCLQDRRLVRKELQRWSKNLLHVVGESMKKTPFYNSIKKNEMKQDVSSQELLVRAASRELCVCWERMRRAYL